MHNTQPVRYTLMDILKSEGFYRDITEAAKISRDSLEASFAAYGDRRRFAINKTLKEDPTHSSAGVDDKGVVYDVIGHGLHVPEDKIRLVAAHFHPFHNIAVPSHSDLEDQLREERGREHKDFVYKGKNYGFNGTYVVGHSTKDGTITLFFYQFTEHPSLIPTELVGNVQNRKTALYQDLQSQNIYSDPNVPLRVAEILNSTRKYRAAVLRFRNKKGYNKELAKLSGFSLLLEIDKEQQNRLQRLIEQAFERA